MDASFLPDASPAVTAAAPAAAPATVGPEALTPASLAAAGDQVRLPASGVPELLFLLFHGVGSHPGHLQPLAERLAAEYPQAAVVSVRAAQAFDGPRGDEPGYQWFSIRGVTEDNRPERVAAAMPAFTTRIAQWRQHFGLPWPRVALAGFSQGAVMALEAVQVQAHLAGRVLAFAGRHARPPLHAPADTTVHLLHGLNDSVIPPGPAIDAAERLIALGGDVTADVLPGIGHELHPRLLERAIEQLRGFLPKKVWRDALAEVPLENRIASSRELD